MDQIELEILRKYGLSPAAYNILTCIDIRDGAIEFKKLASSTLGLVDRSGDYSLADYDIVVQECLSNNLIKVLTREDCEADIKRWENDDNQFCSEIEYVPGNVDFTQNGGLLNAEIRSELATYRSEDPYASITGYSWRLPGLVRIFTACQDTMKAALISLSASSETLSNIKNIQVQTVDSTVEIYWWWINRFVQLPVGYQTSVHYSTAIMAK